MCNAEFVPCSRRWPRTECARRRRRWPIILAGSAGIGLSFFGSVLDGDWRPAPRIIWNVSASVPIGFWRVEPGTSIGRGDVVLARLPDAAAGLAASRHYLPAGVPVLKRVAAAVGDEVCARGKSIFVNGTTVAVRRDADSRGRSLGGWQGCQRLRRGQYILLAGHPDSFDGRYFGAIDREAVIGRAVPLWLP